MTAKTPWRFLYGPRMPAGGFAGNLGQAVNRHLTLRSEPDQNSTFSFDVDGANSPAAAAIAELVTDITVMYGSSFVFRGRVAPSQDTLDDNGHAANFTASDYRDVMRRQALLTGDTLSYTGVDQQQIAWHLIQTAQAHSGGNLGITQGVGAGGVGVLRTMTFATGDIIGTDIQNMALLDSGFEWQIQPYGPDDLRFDCWFPQMGADKGVVLARGMARVQSIARQVDPSAYGNSAYLTGDSSVSLTPDLVSVTGIATRPEGRWDSVIGTTLLTQSALDAAAAQALTDAQDITPTYTIVLQPGTWGGPDDIWLGDTVTVRIKSGRLAVNDALRVVEIDIGIDENDQATVTLTVGKLPVSLQRLLTKMARTLAYLNTR